MTKGRKILIVVSSIILTIAIAWIIIGAIPPKVAVEETNPWRKTDRTLISAHRGGANLNPENTEKAFDYVINETTYTDIVEIDVRLTKDNELVIIHDDSINRTGIKDQNASKVVIRETYYKDLLKYNLGVNFEVVVNDVKTYPYENLKEEDLKSEGLSIMTLNEFLDKYEESRYFRLLLEIKDTKEDAKLAVDKAEQIIATYPEWDERIMMISFSRDAVNHCLENYPDRYVAGLGYNMIEFLIGQQLNLDSLFNVKYHSIQTSMITTAGPISIDCATQSFVDSAHARNQCIAYWTINDETDMRKLIDLGADVITTNSPDVLAKVLGIIE